MSKGKGRAIPVHAYYMSWGFHVSNNWRMKVVRLSAVRTGRLYPPGNIPGTHFSQRLSGPQGHSATVRIISMKNSNDTIGKRTCDLPVCCAGPQPPHTPWQYTCLHIYIYIYIYMGMRHFRYLDKRQWFSFTAL